MAVALRAYTQGTSQGSGSVTIAWPTGTAAGDLAVLVAQDYTSNGPANTNSGWTAVGRGVWYKRVTTGDIAAALAVKGRTTFLQTFTGADKIGTWRNSEGLTLTQAGAGLFVDGWGPSRITTVTPGATDRLGNQIRLTTDNTPNAVWFRAFSTTGYKALTDHDDDCSYVSYEILPIAGPNAPTAILPGSGAGVDNAAPITFSWIHNSNSGAAQEAAQIRLRVSGTGTWSYVKADGTITTTVTTLTQSTPSATVNAAVLSTGLGPYEWQVATQDFGVLGAFSALRYFTPVIAPTVDSITPTSVAESLTPTIAWTRTANVGSPEAWQVRIVPSTESTSDNYLWDSLTTSGAAVQTVAPATVAWTSGQTLYAWVRVMQTGGMWSPWTKDNATFTVTWTPPTAPSTVVPANVANQPLQVTVSGITIGYGVYLEYSYDNITYTPVASATAAATSVVFKVPLAAYGAAAYYRARTSNVVSGVTLYSAWVTSSTLASTDKGSYFVDDDNNYMTISIREEQGPDLVQGITVTYGIGASKPQQDQTDPQGLRGGMTLITADIVEEYNLRAWLTTKGAWTTRWVPEINPGSGTLFRLNTRMALSNAPSVQHVIQKAHAARTVTFEWVEQ